MSTDPMEAEQPAKGSLPRYTRRGFIGAAGAGAGAVALGRIVAPAIPSAYADTSPQVFGRMFPNLPPFAPANNAVRAALREIGMPGGVMDAKDDLAAGPVNLITDPTLLVNNPDNPTHTAGTHFMGQFFDHDITFDTTSKLGVTTSPQQTPNGRTPTFDLDSVYGGGFTSSPQLYNPQDRAKLAIGSGGLFEDLPRTASNVAIVADPRNDENLMIAGLHCAFILFHNNAVDFVRSQNRSLSTFGAFAAARQLTTWHYHWLILKEFLPLFVGQSVVDDVLAHGRRWYRPRFGRAFMPVEFSGGCYRMGHSMVRPSYRANLAGDNGNPFFGFIFDPAAAGQADPSDLRGGAKAPRRFIGWQTFFDFGDGQIKRNKQIDTTISTPLFNIPLQAIPTGDQPQVLPQRNLLRGLTWSLPSGQTLAKVMGVAPLSANDLSELTQFGHGFNRSTPLWYYILKEAHVRAGGLTLGPVGGRVVAEVFIGLLQSDPNSWVATRPNWKPTLPPGNTTGAFAMVDFLKFAGVDPASRGQ